MQIYLKKKIVRPRSKINLLVQHNTKPFTLCSLPSDKASHQSILEHNTKFSTLLSQSTTSTSLLQLHQPHHQEMHAHILQPLFLALTLLAIPTLSSPAPAPSGIPPMTATITVLSGPSPEPSPANPKPSNPLGQECGQCITSLKFCVQEIEMAEYDMWCGNQAICKGCECFDVVIPGSI